MRMAGISLLAALALGACSGHPILPFSASGGVEPPAPRDTSTLVQLGGSTLLPPAPPDFATLGIPLPDQEEQQENFRHASMREGAMSWGARAGQARRSWEIAVSYTTRAADLDTAWDFKRVAVAAPLSSGWLLPPVIQRGGSVWSASSRGAEAATEYYSILRPGRIAGRLPDWRDYLPAPAGAPEAPLEELLPRPGEEKQWREWAAEGWEAGQQLAEAELEESLARLERDYTGMLEFRRLLAMGMVSDMVVEAEHWPASVIDNGSELRIGGRKVRMVSDAGFVGDTGRWKPQIVPVAPTPGWSSFPPVMGLN